MENFQENLEILIYSDLAVHTTINLIKETLLMCNAANACLAIGRIARIRVKVVCKIHLLARATIGYLVYKG